MKKVILSIALLSIVSLGIYSCNKEDLKNETLKDKKVANVEYFTEDIQALNGKCAVDDKENPCQSGQCGCTSVTIRPVIFRDFKNSVLNNTVVSFLSNENNFYEISQNDTYRKRLLNSIIYGQMSIIADNVVDGKYYIGKSETLSTTNYGSVLILN